MRSSNGKGVGPASAPVAAILAAAVVAFAACSGKPAPGEKEETPTATSEVPEVVLAAADLLGRRTGNGRCGTWARDHEDQDWECAFVGLRRRAELDILPDGTFSELELVYSLAELERALPEQAAHIRSRCSDAPDVSIELSLRREEHLADIPELPEAWSLSGVVLEFQCPDGAEYEIDALDHGVTRRIDDTTDGARR